jgi:hypothetical protein
MSSKLTDLTGTETQKTLDAIKANGPQVTVGANTEEATAKAAYSWRNGWGVAGYVKKKWRGPRSVDAGAEVTWKPKD